MWDKEVLLVMFQVSTENRVDPQNPSNWTDPFKTPKFHHNFFVKEVQCMRFAYGRPREPTLH